MANINQMSGATFGLNNVTAQPATRNTLQVTQVPQATFKPQVTYQPQQPAASVQYQGITQAPAYTGGGGGGITTNTGGGYSNYNSWAAQQAAAQRQAEAEAARKAAEEEAKRSELRTNIQNLINNSLGIYDSLYGNARTAAASQRQALDKRYDTETGALSEQFTQELPKIGQSYAGRGAYDSSYRMGAENAAQKGYEGQLNTLSTQRQADAAKIGQALAEQEAQFEMGKSKIGLLGGRLGEIQDINELTQLRNEMDNRIAELNASRAGLQSQEAYRQKFAGLAPATDRLAGLKTQLSTLIQGQAPGPLKRAVAEQIIGSAGLTEEEKAQLTGIVNSQIA